MGEGAITVGSQENFTQSGAEKVKFHLKKRISSPVDRTIVPLNITYSHSQNNIQASCSHYILANICHYIYEIIKVLRLKKVWEIVGKGLCREEMMTTSVSPQAVQISRSAN